jgi:hypothetical protein
MCPEAIDKYDIDSSRAKDGKLEVITHFFNYFELNSLRTNINTVLAFRIMEGPKACSDFH